MQHRTLLARRLMRPHDGTDGGDPPPGVPTSMRARCTCRCLQGFCWTQASDRCWGARRSLAGETIRSPAAGHSGHAQPPAPASTAPRVSQSRTPPHLLRARTPPTMQAGQGSRVIIYMAQEAILVDDRLGTDRN
jgi:hypothetical protein